MKTHVLVAGLMLAVLSLLGCSGPSGLELQQQLTESLGVGRELITGDNKPTGRKQTVHAIARGCRFDLSWIEGSLVRRVNWQDRDGGFAFEIGLQKRGSPWTYADAGVTQTMYGPYQPSFRVRDSSGTWAITMRHEQVDFPTDQDLVNMLRWPYYAESDAWALSADGTFAELRVDRSPAGNSLGVKLNRLTVRGAPPKPDTLAPFIRGKIYTKCEPLGAANP